ncbi:LAETG motif-containing sortase-dependent surface protein [Streptomyces cellostaticus]|uniref:LAETG motif-containing sortase-dependent surface protein n=1 Tax=Streptomyces cellostaticus TaxID=67285 RepID=UPI0020269FFF|nr:LAETG motif-containing sortase-dependent surface protein [Streptomyces cellostaticus]
MSIARRVTARRLLGTGAASLALCAASVAAASGAWAHGTHGGDGWKTGGHYAPGTGAGTETGTDRCQFSLDGVSFFDSVKVDDQNLRPTEDGKVHVKVRAAEDAAGCTASLASYLAHGASFATSGEQVLVGFDTVAVKPGETDSLDIAVPDAGCFAQVDLYRGAVRFDGRTDANDGFEHGDLPKGPDHPVIKDKLIAAWNGGAKDCTGTPEEPQSPSPSAPAEESAGPGPSASESSAAPSPSSSESAPAPSPSESRAGSVPTPNGGGDDGGDLAETGGGGDSGLIAGGAAVLVAGGAAFVLLARRRRGAQG